MRIVNNLSRAINLPPSNYRDRNVEAYYQPYPPQQKKQPSESVKQKTGFWGRFTSLVDIARMNRFLVLGDQGSHNENQMRVAQAIWQRYLNPEDTFGFALILGDNVYENGESELFNDAIYRPYEPLWKAGVQFCPVLGNHDVRQHDGSIQLNYWHALQEQFTRKILNIKSPQQNASTTPRYYTFMSPNEKVQFFALDTTVFLPGLDGTYKNNHVWARQLAKEQIQWLKKELARSKAEYKVVYGHYPLCASGMHASLEQKEMEQLSNELGRVFIDYGVDLYLTGHEHHYEKVRPFPFQQPGFVQIISGGGGKKERIFYPDKPPYPGIREAVISDFNFLVFDTNQDELTYKVISGDNAVLLADKVPRKHQSGQQIAIA